MISLNNTSIFKGILGDRIKLLGSTALHISDGTIKSLEMDLLINCNKNSIHFGCDYKVGFFENETGDVFYDYQIEIGTFKNTSIIKSDITFNTTEIIKVEIYGRDFRSEDFISFPDLYKKIKNETKTDDMFVLVCKNGEQLMVIFHPYFPSIEVNFNRNKIEDFWSQYGSCYKLHYTIK